MCTEARALGLLHWRLYGAAAVVGPPRPCSDGGQQEVRGVIRQAYTAPSARLLAGTGKVKAHQSDIGSLGSMAKWLALGNEQADIRAKEAVCNLHPAFGRTAELNQASYDFATFVIKLAATVLPLYPRLEPPTRLPAARRAASARTRAPMQPHAWQRLSSGWRCSTCLRIGARPIVAGKGPSAKGCLLPSLTPL